MIKYILHYLPNSRGFYLALSSGRGGLGVEIRAGQLSVSQLIVSRRCCVDFFFFFSGLGQAVGMAGKDRGEVVPCIMKEWD